jgi:cytochrome d ubiquinol oxidase subunit II
MLDPPPDLTQAAGWMPMVFLVVMGLAMLAYVVLDGYDLGVGVLMNRARDDKDSMIASISPFWDANETWLVLGVGILLTVFPMAHGVILGALYLHQWPDADRPDAAWRGVRLPCQGACRSNRSGTRAFFWQFGCWPAEPGYMLGSLITL